MYRKLTFSVWRRAIDLGILQRPIRLENITHHRLPPHAQSVDHESGELIAKFPHDCRLTRLECEEGRNISPTFGDASVWLSYEHMSRDLLIEFANHHRIYMPNELLSVCVAMGASKVLLPTLK